MKLGVKIQSMRLDFFSYMKNMYLYVIKITFVSPLISSYYDEVYLYHICIVAQCALFGTTGFHYPFR